MNRQKLNTCFVGALGIAPSTDLDTLSFGSTDGWDSVGHIALVTELELAFEVELSPENITELTSAQKAIEILGQHGVTFDN